MTNLHHLRNAATSVVVDTATGVPVIRHWGAALPAGTDLRSTVRALARGVNHGQLDVVADVSIVPAHADGFPGRAGLQGHRQGGVAWAPRFGPHGEPRTTTTPEGSTLVVDARDTVAELSLRTVVSLRTDGAMVIGCTLRNDGTARYLLDRLTVTLPVGADAAELLTFTGRWTRETHAVRVPWSHGAWSAENTSGRTSHEHPPLVWALGPGAGEWAGEVWGAHLAWSGNHVVLAECLPDGRRYLQLGELLHPGELCLEPGESYETPDVVAVHHTSGLTPASWAFHRLARSRDHHPGPERPRPVLLNTWEAVYFDHGLERLKQLADVAASVGVERFVLDDGWFGSRRDDRSGLGDWWVSPDAHPGGLRPLVDHVRGFGMEFGIWVEPEMVSPDSDLFRAHPDWALVTTGYEAVTGRHQLVLDLARADAFDHVLGQLDALLGDHDIAFVKWDMNRDHVQGSGARGAAGTHEQTLALYRLLDELRRRHPAVEFESCSSGGGRVDLAILERTERVWTSDCNDALERALVQRGTSYLLPPELIGAHIGPPRSHTTGRRQSLAVRAAVALFGHLGIEWNVLEMSVAELDALAEVVALHRRFRPLLHAGDSVRFDLAPNGPGDPPAAVAHGVYAADRREALLSYVQLRTGMSLAPPPWRIPGLPADVEFEVRHVPLPGGIPGAWRSLPPWLDEPLVLSGAQLAAHGIQPPSLHPESAVLVHLRAL